MVEWVVVCTSRDGDRQTWESFDDAESAHKAMNEYRDKHPENRYMAYVRSVSDRFMIKPKPDQYHSAHQEP